MGAMGRVEKRLVNSALFTWLHAERGQRRMLGFAASEPQGPVLEIGCGAGATTDRLLRRLPGRRVVALDYDSEEVGLARKRLGERAEVHQGDARSLPFPDASFATVVEMNALHHIREWPQVLREIHRVLVPGGQFLFMDYTRRFMGGLFSHHAFQPGRFDRRELTAALTDAGFPRVDVAGRWIVFGCAVRP